jgi:hypothetical protein
MLGRRRIEILPVGEPAFLQLFRPVNVIGGRGAHGHGDDPFAFGRARRRLADDLQDFSNRSTAVQRDSSPMLQAVAIHVRMRVEEARRHGLARDVQHRRAGTLVLQHLGVRAHRGDAAVAHADRCRDARAAIERDDPAAVKDELVLRHAALRQGEQ